MAKPPVIAKEFLQFALRRFAKPQMMPPLLRGWKRCHNLRAKP
jgi:hypothetical protein